MFRLSLFSGFQLEDLAGNTIKLRTRKAQLLFAYLCLYPRMDHSRERLIDLFWPEIPLDKADNNLRQAIHTLRPVVEAGDISRGSILMAKQGLVRLELPESVSFDVQQFERKLKEGLRLSGEAKAVALQEAVALYRGDLLEGSYDDWCLESQNHYRAQYLRALGELVTHFAENKGVEQAIRYARMSLAKDRLQEEVHRQLMYLYHAQGDRAAAIQQYQECKRVLAEALNVEPSPETETLYREIESRSSVRKIETIAEEARKLFGRYPELRAPFVNREAELLKFTQAMEQAQAGKTQALLFSGEAGIGKTRLAQECLHYAESHGFLTLKGRCYDIEGSLPYQALIDALRLGLPHLGREQLDRVSALWLGEVAKLVPEVIEMLPHIKPSAPFFTPEQERNRLFEGISQFLVGLSQGLPLALFVDDLQWGDISTLQFLSYFTRHVTQARILLLGAFREEEVQAGHFFWPVLHQLVRDQLVEQVALAPLQEEKMSELVGGMLKTTKIAKLNQRIYADSKGYPFFAEEIVKSYVQHGILALDEERQWKFKDNPATLIASKSICGLIESRMRHISLAGRELLEHGAVTGPVFGSLVLGRVLGVLDADIRQRAEELLRAGLIETEGTSFIFRHDLTRQALCDSLPPERKRLMHAKVADALEVQITTATKDIAADSRLIGDLARHFVEAHHWEKALEYNLKAGWQFWKQTYAKEETLHYFRQALEIAERLGDQEGQMQAYKGLGEVCAFCDEQGGLEYCQNALQLCKDNECRAEIYCAMANVYQLHKDLEGGLPLLQTALKELEGQMESLTLVRTLYHLSNYSNWMGRPSEAIHYCQRALDVLSRLEDDGWQALILSEFGHAYGRQDQFDAAIEHLTKAVKIGEKTGDQHALKMAVFHLGRAYFRSKKAKEAIAQWKKVLHICELAGHSTNDIASISAWIAKAYMILGQLKEALAYAETALKNDLTAKIDINIALSHVALSCLYEAMGLPKQAAEAAKNALDLAPDNPSVFQTAIENHLLLNQLEHALEWLERGKAHLTRRRLDALQNYSKFSHAAKRFVAHPTFKALWQQTRHKRGRPRFKAGP